ncbi:MAG: response regulator [Phenylobacterium sp.]|uniref:response regulator n=1 Tax=Phenylobacterium sp. TaxID=1871053 RepID=UPI00391CFECD
MSGLGALRILIIDDNAQMRTIIGTALSAAGVRDLHYAATGRQGLEQLAGLPIDVVYVDYEMPGMNGLDFLSAARRLPGDKRYTPVIMLTGHSDLPRLNAARDRGVNEFLAKPVTARNILLRLNAVIYHPRDFIDAPGYFGPDRRRRADLNYRGPRRRRADAREMVEL